MPYPQPAFISEADYLAAENDGQIRHEYVAGQIFAMSGASDRHGRIAANLSFHARAAARGGPCSVISSDMKVRVADQSIYYYPDLVVACDPNDNADQYFKDRPCLVAEVLSPSTESIDRREKLLVYRGIPCLRYYLMADSRRRHVTVSMRDANNAWQQMELGEGETLALDCAELSFKLTLDDIYEDIHFDEVQEEAAVYA